MSILVQLEGHGSCVADARPFVRILLHRGSNSNDVNASLHAKSSAAHGQRPECRPGGRALDVQPGTTLGNQTFSRLKP